jgi:hypothetical protein
VAEFSSKNYSCSANQSIPHISRNSNIHYRIHKNRSPVPFLSQINPVHIIRTDFFKIHFNISLPFTCRSSKWSLPLIFPHQNSLRTSPFTHTCHKPGSSHCSKFDKPITAIQLQNGLVSELLLEKWYSNSNSKIQFLKKFHSSKEISFLS